MTYVEAPTPVQVLVTVAGEQRHGWVLGWREGRVYVRYRGPNDGQHLAWVPAAAVERAEG